MWHGEFRHPRLVEIYDAQFSWYRQATGVDPARASLDAAQAKPDAVDQIYGGWDGGPVGSTDGELLVLAHRSAATGH